MQYRTRTRTYYSDSRKALVSLRNLVTPAQFILRCQAQAS